MWAAPLKALLTFSPVNSRALLCVDHKANHLSAAIRKAAVRFLQTVAEGNQCGAIKGGGTAFPMFIARLFLRSASIRRVSAALLFGDMRKA